MHLGSAGYTKGGYLTSVLEPQVADKTQEVWERGVE
jgi:hypothetical protein